MESKLQSFCVFVSFFFTSAVSADWNDRNGDVRKEYTQKKKKQECEQRKKNGRSNYKNENEV